MTGPFRSVAVFDFIEAANAHIDAAPDTTSRYDAIEAAIAALDFDDAIRLRDTLRVLANLVELHAEQLHTDGAK